MSVPLNYQDTVQLVLTVLPLDGSTTEIVGEIQEVPALYIQRTGWIHANNEDTITSDGEIYLDPTNEFVVDNVYRLEEMLVIANPFGDQVSDAWYKITDVTVAMDKLLYNNIDNILVRLKKTTEVPYVS